MPSECMLQRHCFKKKSRPFQIVSNSVRMHALMTLFSKKISVVLNRFKYVRMHTLETLFSFVSLQFQIVSNTIRMHALETLFSFVSLQFQIVSNTIRMHALQTLFSKCSLSKYDLFQIVSDCTLYLVFKIVSAVPKYHFK